MTDHGAVRGADVDLPGIYAALGSLSHMIITSSRDWSLAREDAWTWGVLAGWDCEADECPGTDCVECEGSSSIPGLAQRHGWTQVDIERLRTLRRSVRSLTRINAGDIPALLADRAATVHLDAGRAGEAFTHLESVLAAESDDNEKLGFALAAARARVADLEAEVERLTECLRHREDYLLRQADGQRSAALSWQQAALEDRARVADLEAEVAEARTAIRVPVGAPTPAGDAEACRTCGHTTCPPTETWHNYNPALGADATKEA